MGRIVIETVIKKNKMGCTFKCKDQNVAERIIQLAQQQNVPIKKDPGLAQILSQLDIDNRIPPELYKAVAEILAFVYSLNEQFRAGIEKPGSESATRPDASAFKI